MANDPFYWSVEWREFRKRMLAERRVCQVAECGKRAGHVDHVISRRRGGAPLDPSNVQCLCHSHHSEKTARHDGGFGNPLSDAVPGCDVNGRPLDPAHPWNRTAALAIPATARRVAIGRKSHARGA